MLARSLPRWSRPDRMHREDSGESIEGSLVGDEGSVVRLPPVSLKEAGHDAVAATSMPDEDTARREHASEFGDDAPVVGGFGEKTERREQVEHCVEAAGPARRELAHIAARVAEPRSGAAAARARQQLRRVIETVNVEARLGEQMCVPALTARHVEEACARG